jgi:hypothetical protein
MFPPPNTPPIKYYCWHYLSTLSHHPEIQPREAEEIRNWMDLIRTDEVDIREEEGLKKLPLRLALWLKYCYEWQLTQEGEMDEKIHKRVNELVSDWFD